jgi:polysaccharide export outer membrane protein
MTVSGSAQTPTQENRQEYIIESGDLLSITFWQKPEFNTEARVTAAGSIELPLIGTIQAAGLTPGKLRDVIVNRISLHDVRVTQVAVVVREYRSKNVYVTGSVLTPGKLQFEVIPNLWQILLEAGGPAPNAMLNDVTIVRGSGREAGRIIHLDLTSALERGDLSALPAIYPNDTVHIPGIAAGEGTATSMPPSPLERRNVVYVFGQVTTPGVFNLDKNMDLLDAVVLAGGPTDAANLKEVGLYYRGRRQSQMAIVDLNKYMKRSIPLPLQLHPGDMVYVPRRRAFPPIVSEIGRFVLTTAASVLVFTLAR